MRILVIGGTACSGPDVVTRLRAMQRSVALFHRGQTAAVVNTTRVRQELGYVEPVLPDEALSRTAEWERTHPPQELDPRSFDYAAEDAILAELETQR